MPIDLYYTPGSSPCRAVLLTAKAVGIELNLKHLDLMKGEQLSESFVKINPQHCVPTLVDNGFALWESRAIATYLIDKYAKDDSLYPKDVKQRAIVDQRLYFDMGTLYQRFADYYYPIFFYGGNPDPEKFKRIEEAFKFLDTYLEGEKYVATKHLTVADLVIVASVSSYDVAKFDISKYPNVERWYENIKVTAPGYEEGNAKPLLQFKQLIDSITNK